MKVRYSHYVFAGLSFALGACSSSATPDTATNATSAGVGAASDSTKTSAGATAAPPSAGKPADMTTAGRSASTSGGTIAGAGGTPASGNDIGQSGSGGSSGQSASAGQPATAGQAGSSGGGAGASGGEQDPRATCVAALKPACKMRDTSACGSFVTADIGTLIKATEIKFGPYGATMEYNVGKGFEIPVDSAEANCAQTAAAFGEPADVTMDAADLKDVDLSLYTVYRPACMIGGEKYPVITWGNGTCGQTEIYGALLRYVASYGYVIFAANSRYTGGNGAMTKALDFAESVSKDQNSIYYGRLDLTKIGAMGHSQGGMATVTAAQDMRVKAAIIWNAGTSASKPFLTVSGEHDLTGYTAQSMASAIQNSTQPAAYLFYHMVPETGSVSGHLTLTNQPERVVEQATAWWDFILKGDMKARDMLVGMGCGLCSHSDDFEYGEHNLQ
jgi:pimeloyl-ACP methyl ester carboxylesterase